MRRQLAQAQIELGQLDEAIALLQGVAGEIAQGGSDKQKSEIGGLLGRAMKQRFVEAVKERQGRCR